MNNQRGEGAGGGCAPPARSAEAFGGPRSRTCALLYHVGCC